MNKPDSNNPFSIPSASSDSPKITWNVQTSKRAVKYLKKLTPQLKQALLDAIKGLKNYPNEGDIKPLTNRPEQRLRVGGIRILFTVNEEEEIIRVTTICPRGDVYKK